MQPFTINGEQFGTYVKLPFRPISPSKRPHIRSTSVLSPHSVEDN